MRVLPNRSGVVEKWTFTKGEAADYPDRIGYALVSRGYAEDLTPPEPYRPMPRVGAVKSTRKRKP